MNTEEIRRALQNVKHFADVYSIDTLPAHPRGILVCNLDPFYRSGNHWLCNCVVDGTHGDYFDTFGRAPPKTLKDYMNASCERWTYNSRQIQSVVSSFCGHYCIYFCMLRSRGLTMNEIVTSFSSDTGFNDCMVVRDMGYNGTQDDGAATDRVASDALSRPGHATKGNLRRERRYNGACICMS